MALESYGVGATFLFTVFLQISYGLGADLKIQLVVCSDGLRTIFTDIIKWYIQVIGVDPLGVARSSRNHEICSEEQG
jgi:hypothetical protein